jgi:hypothetical protein
VCRERRQPPPAATVAAAWAGGRTGLLSHPREGIRGCSTYGSADKIPRLWCTKRRARGASCLPTGNRRIPVRSPAAAAPSASCTGEAPLLWSAVCSQTSMGGRPRGAKMTRGGGRLTSRAPTRAWSASGPQGRQEPGRRPACDALDSDGDSAGDSEEQPTGQPIGGSAPARRRPRTCWSASWITRAQGAETLGHDRQDAAAAGAQELVPFLLSAGRCAACRSAPLGSVSPPLLRAPRSPCPRCAPRWLAPGCSCDLPRQVWSLTYAARALRVDLCCVHALSTA